VRLWHSDAIALGIFAIHMRLQLLLATLCLAFLARALPADEPPRAFLISESPLGGRLVGIDREWNLSFDVGEKVRVVAIHNLAYWGVWREAAAGPQILLAGGQVIHADVLKLDDQSLVLGDATGLGRGLWDESTLPRSVVQAILYQPPADAAERDKLIDKLAAPTATSEDRLLFAGGETISGTLVSAPLDGRFRPEKPSAADAAFQLLRRGSEEPLAVPAGKVTAIVLGSAAPAATAPQAVWLGMREGSLVHCTGIDVKEGVVSLKLTGGGTLVTTLAGRENPDGKFWDEIMLIQPSAERVAWLSDRPNLGYKHVPWLSIEWPFAADRCAAGSRLRSGTGVYLKGLGMHSTARLAYDVTGYKRFAAELAVDDIAGLEGSVVFRVLLLGSDSAWRTAYESPVIRGGDPPSPISIDLQGASRMALIVEFADRGDVCDQANWLSARLVK
jgi:hypothetical protein